MANMNLEEYKKQLHKQLIESYFSKNTEISGNDILRFSPEKQINLMVIYLLMEQWELEMENNKSPYFNYESEDVKGALKSYMNTLSKNISIKKDVFSTLLEKAIGYTIQLVENPESFVIVNKLEGKIPKLKKYIHYHKAYFEGDLDYEINSKLDLVKDNLKEIIVFKEAKQDEDIQNIQDEMTPTPSIHEKLIENSTTQTLADKLGGEVQSAEKITIEPKIESIKNAISINQRFTLVNALFNDSTEQYMDAIERLDNCNSQEEAQTLLRSLLQDKYEKEETKQLITLIEQKFNLTAK